MLRNTIRRVWLASRPSINTRKSFIPLQLTLRVTNVWSSIPIIQPSKSYSTETNSNEGVVDVLKFEHICEETLESLCEYFEELTENCTHLKGADVTFGDGVLTVHFGSPYGTYVINRQAPNKQIWLSSPTSGPKRYDLILQNGGYWIYKHDNRSLHQLLNEEIPKIVKKTVDFSKCSHSLV